MVYWNEPSERNGYITNYTVLWYSQHYPYTNMTEFNNDVFMYNITTLNPFITYYIGVYANTSKGAGDYDTQMITTLQAGKSIM